MRILLVLVTAVCLQAQRPEYDFYAEGRDKKPDVYAEELRKTGVPEKSPEDSISSAIIGPNLRQIAGTASTAIREVSTTGSQTLF